MTCGQGKDLVHQCTLFCSQGEKDWDKGSFSSLAWSPGSMLGMLLSFQRSWFSFTCGGLVPTVITLAVTVAIVSEKVPCLVLGTKTKGCLSPLQFGRRLFSAGWCVAVHLLQILLEFTSTFLEGTSKYKERWLAVFLRGNPQQYLHFTHVFYQLFLQHFIDFTPVLQKEKIFVHLNEHKTSQLATQGLLVWNLTYV